MSYSDTEAAALREIQQLREALTQAEQERDKFYNLFSDYEDPCMSYEQAECIWNEMASRRGIESTARRQAEAALAAMTAENAALLSQIREMSMGPEPRGD